METETIAQPAQFTYDPAAGPPNGPPTPSGPAGSLPGPPAGPPPGPPSGPPPGGRPPSDPPTGPPASPQGLKPTPDPTRSGARWVGGAGVALLLAAAAVLTAVRWDDIGQSVKLGGLVAITLALLAAGDRFKKTIPMTAEAIFHLGALLIPFDMAAVAILAGRSWQETLLLTSVTSVGSWYAIERARPSSVLRWAARGAVVVLAAGIAAVSPLAMPLALATAAAVAIVARRPAAAALWATIAGLLPVAAFVPWPSRIAGAMSDLGFDSLDQWQPLAAGILATVTLGAVTRFVPRAEIAWASVILALVTAGVALGGFESSQLGFLTVAGAFLAVEVLALASLRDKLWKPILDNIALAAEIIAAMATGLIIVMAGFSDLFDTVISPTGLGASAVMLALGWLLADRRRLDEPLDEIVAMVVGSNWELTTIMFPMAVLASVLGFAAPAWAVSITAVALAYWMVATWRTGAEYGAMALGWIAVAQAIEVDHWAGMATGAAVAAILMLAARFRVRAKDDFGAIMASVVGVLLFFFGSVDAIDAYNSGWPLVVFFAGAWSLSWIAERRGPRRTVHPIDFAGRITALGSLVLALAAGPVVGLAMCGVLFAMACADYLMLRRAGAAEGSLWMTGYALVAGVAVAFAGIPVGELAGLTTSHTGVALTILGFVAVGVALASPRLIELPLGATAAVATGLGLLLASAQAGPLAAALLIAGCTALFAGAALRDLILAVGGYTAVSIGAALQLAVWDVTWIEPYLILPAIAALYVGYRYQRNGGSSWVAYAPIIGLFSYIAIADRIGGGSAWHAVIAGAIGVFAVIAGGYRRLAGPLVSGSVILAIVVGYESLGPAALVPTWAWLALGGSVLLAAGVAMERSDTTPLERGQQIRNVIATQFS